MPTCRTLLTAIFSCAVLAAAVPAHAVSTGIGIYQNGAWYLDASQSWDWNGTPADIYGVFGVGIANAAPVAGDWNGDGKSEIGVYANGIWYLDMNGNWQWDGEGVDVRGVFGVGIANAVPVTGDWNGDGRSEIGIYSEGNWYLDKNANWQWDGATTDTYGLFGIGLPNVIPVTGDWNGSGSTKIGVYSDGSWYLDRNASWQWDGVPTDTYGLFGLGLGSATPVTGTWTARPLAEQYAIDGIVDLSAFPGVQQSVIDMKSLFGTGVSVGTTTLRYAIVNDERHLYAALEWTDATLNTFDPFGALDDFDGVVVMFDNNGNGTFEENEDARRLVMHMYGSGYGDLHNVSSGSDADAIGDGLGKMTWYAGVYHAEFLVPLAPDTTGEDGVVNSNTRFNINLLDHIQVAVPDGNIGSLSGAPNMSVGMNSSGWPLLPYAAPAPHDQPRMPDNLTGLIAFISDHEEPKGEVYTFDPATSLVSRVTNSTGLYLDGVSLSHDRARIAVFAAPVNTDFANYEIYTVNVDGSNPMQLTTNAILDGHPAWSPDDSTIAYASFRDGWNASIVTMTSATGGELRNLTPQGQGFNDNDPDWLPDGRIVFKTNRFNTALPDQVRIAVMNADGSMVTQLTSSPGTSDHDPTATSTVAVFERFTRDTNYSQDPWAIYSPWNIVEARVDGSGERTLLADGWVNWLPVHDPTGQYLVYLKSVGYTDARLMNKDGRDLGRLIPGITRIRYIDWK